MARLKASEYDQKKERENEYSDAINSIYVTVTYVCMIWQEESTDCSLFHVTISLIKKVYRAKAVHVCAM